LYIRYIIYLRGNLIIGICKSLSDKLLYTKIIIKS
jgi:hypothetical protein